jgi:hypothetical protein
MAVSVPIMRVRHPIAARRVPIVARGQSSSRRTGNAASCQCNTCHAAGGAHGIACERVARCMRCCDRNGLADAATTHRLRTQAHTQGAQARMHSLTGTGARLRTDANSHAGGSCSSKSRRLRRSARGAGWKRRPNSGALPCLAYLPPSRAPPCAWPERCVPSAHSPVRARRPLLAVRSYEQHHVATLCGRRCAARS